MKLFFVSPFATSPSARDPGLLIVADCPLSEELARGLAGHLPCNVDLLYVDTSRRTRSSRRARHVSYARLALRARRLAPRYRHVLFWQQFIGLYWGLLNRRACPDLRALLMPLIYRRRPGLPGRMYQRFFRWALRSPALTGAICLATEERKYYQSLFPECAKKFFFAPYGLSIPQPGPLAPGDTVGEYLFSGGTSNRDYALLAEAARDLLFPLVVACPPAEAERVRWPSRVRVELNAYGPRFDEWLAHARAVVIPLKDPNISAGQIVILEAMQMGRPLIVTRSAGTVDYVDEDCAFLIPAGDAGALRRAIEYVLHHPDEARRRGAAAQARHAARFTTRHFADALGDLLATGAQG